jgi:hypothetical protein
MKDTFKRASSATDLDKEIEGVFGDNNNDSLSSARMFESAYGARAERDNQDAAALRDPPAMPAIPKYASKQYEDENVATTANGDVTNVESGRYGEESNRAKLLDRSMSFEEEKRKKTMNHVQAKDSAEAFQRQTSHTMKVFDDGDFVDVDVGAAVPPRAATRTDPLSKSLQDWQLKKMSMSPPKPAPRQSVDQGAAAKCVYDERMFQGGMAGTGSGRGVNSGGNRDSVTEEEYFKRMMDLNNTPCLSGVSTN